METLEIREILPYLIGVVAWFAASWKKKTDKRVKEVEKEQAEYKSKCSVLDEKVKEAKILNSIAQAKTFDEMTSLAKDMSNLSIITGQHEVEIKNLKDGQHIISSKIRSIEKEGRKAG